VVRGEISITALSVDCNMAQQNAEGLPKNAAEHSAMLAFAGQRYSAKPSATGMPRFVYVGFQSVALKDVRTLNGGYADDVWFSRGYFNPNIEQVTIERLTSSNRVNPRRATISFSGLCQNVEIRDVDIDSLHMEETSSPTYDHLPRQSDVFEPSLWRLENVTAKNIGLAAKASPPQGNVYVLEASNLKTGESFGPVSGRGRYQGLHAATRIRQRSALPIEQPHVRSPDLAPRPGHGGAGWRASTNLAIRQSVHRHLLREHVSRQRECQGRRDPHQRVLTCGA
jgi:hypothetical protein